MDQAFAFDCHLLKALSKIITAEMSKIKTNATKAKPIIAFLLIF